MSDRVDYRHIADMPGLVLGTARFSKFSFDRHFHLDYHIGLVTEGVQRLGYGGKTVLTGPGSVSLMPPGEIHDGVGVGERGYTLRTFRLSRELLGSVAEDLSGTAREPELAGATLEDPEVAAQLVRLFDVMQASGQSGALAVQSEWLRLLNLLLTRSRAIVPQQESGALSPQQWQRVRDYCFAHLSEKITLDALAALCDLGRFQFLRQFKQTVGMTPHAWLLRLRLEHACSMLSRSSQTIAEVAQGVGFYDQSHFNRAFRQAFGVAPSGY
ncbi:AraC family transcriptional regulator [Trinickia dinghuensis]|uniref:AraC family transcriptional regulator n=1 Tax=Trinickia dinghuensis TaxID=2291023 RepID=A0A3D8JYA0_9BURK|nr:AraC family transcriptional regulator [Trinickia dinghuensis]RDU97626.1 AraC family transcriptional regulator [Trinickia dinghuensis]